MEENSSRLIFTSDTSQTQDYVLIILDICFFILEFLECFLKLCNFCCNSNMPHVCVCVRDKEVPNLGIINSFWIHFLLALFDMIPITSLPAKQSAKHFFFFSQSFSPGCIWIYRLASNLSLSAISLPGWQVLMYSGVPFTKATVHPDCFGHPAPCLLHIWCVYWGGRAPCASHNGCTAWI